MTNLVQSWLSLYATSRFPDGDRRAAVEALNAELGRRTRESKLGEWLNGKEAIPPAVQELMRHDVITYHYKITTKFKRSIAPDASKILELIRLPERK